MRASRDTEFELHAADIVHVVWFNSCKETVHQRWVFEAESVKFGDKPLVGDVTIDLVTDLRQRKLFPYGLFAIKDAVCVLELDVDFENFDPIQMVRNEEAAVAILQG